MQNSANHPLINLFVPAIKAPKVLEDLIYILKI